MTYPDNPFSPALLLFLMLGAQWFPVAFEYSLARYGADDGGHDVIDNFEIPRNSMKNLILIGNFTNTVMKNVK